VAQESNPKDCPTAPSGNTPAPSYQQLFVSAMEGIEIGRSEDAGKAITKLQWAISKRKDSKSNDTYLSEPPFDYLPYLWLAKAYLIQGNTTAAVACYEIEEGKGEMKNANTKKGKTARDDFAKGMKNIKALDSVKKLADEILGWQEKFGLSSDAGSLLKDIQKSVAELESAGGSSEDTVKRLLHEMTKLCSVQLEASRKQGEKYSTGEWKWGTTTGCPALTEGHDATSVGAGIDAVEKCEEGVHALMVAAGNAACQKLKNKRDSLEARRVEIDATAKQAGVAIGTLPGIPDATAECIDASFDSLSRADLGKQLEQIKPGATLDGLEQVREKMENMAAGMTDALASNMQRTLHRMPELTPECARSLRVEEYANDLNAQRSRLKSAIEAVTAGGKDFSTANSARVGADQLNSVGDAKLSAGVDQLLQQAGECAGGQPANTISLTDALGDYKQNHSTDASKALCDRAISFDKVVQASLAQCAETIQKNVFFYGWLTQAASTLVTSVRTRSESAQCAEQSAQNLRGLGKGVTPAWLKRASEAVGSARICLAGIRDERNREGRRIWEELARALEAAESIGGGPGPPPGETLTQTQKDTVGRMKSDLEKARKGLPSVTDLWKYPLDESSLKKVDLAVELKPYATREPALRPPEDWKLRSGPDYVEAWLAVRDSALSDGLKNAKETLVVWEKTASGLAPFVALKNAFVAFQQGRLDEAILTVRHGIKFHDGREGDSSTQKASFLLHTALAYFLHAKQLALEAVPHEPHLAALLEQSALAKSAREEIRLAKSLDPANGEARVNTELFKNKSFQKLYESTR